MPLYTYVCPGCNKPTERVSSIADMDKQLCECGTALTRDEIPPSNVAPGLTLEYAAWTTDNARIEVPHRMGRVTKP